MGLQAPSGPWVLSLVPPLGTLCSVQGLTESTYLCICQVLAEPLQRKLYEAPISKCLLATMIVSGPLVILCPYIFWCTAKLISRVGLPACNLTSNGGVFLFLHILTSTCCHLSFWSYTFWLEGGAISGLFWFAFPGWRLLNISLGASQSFDSPQVKILCLSLYTIF